MKSASAVWAGDFVSSPPKEVVHPQGKAYFLLAGGTMFFLCGHIVFCYRLFRQIVSLRAGLAAGVPKVSNVKPIFFHIVYEFAIPMYHNAAEAFGMPL